MGQIISFLTGQQETNVTDIKENDADSVFNASLELAITYSEYILNDDQETIYIDIDADDFIDNWKTVKQKLKSSHGELIVIYRDIIMKTLASKTFEKMNPHLYSRIIFYSQNCTKIVVLKNDDMTNKAKKSKSEQVSMCVNVSGIQRQHASKL